MSAEQPKLEFFSDIKEKLFLILGGIISLATVIPAFLNSTSEIFGWEHIVYGYVVFVLVYFIAPYVFYLFYCSIHDNGGYLELLPASTYMCCLVCVIKAKSENQCLFPTHKTLFLSATI